MVTNNVSQSVWEYDYLATNNRVGDSATRNRLADAKEQNEPPNSLLEIEQLDVQTFVLKCL